MEVGGKEGIWEDGDAELRLSAHCNGICDLTKPEMSV